MAGVVRRCDPAVGAAEVEVRGLSIAAPRPAGGSLPAQATAPSAATPPAARKSPRRSPDPASSHRRPAWSSSVVHRCHLFLVLAALTGCRTRRRRGRRRSGRGRAVEVDGPGAGVVDTTSSSCTVPRPGSVVVGRRRRGRLRGVGPDVPSTFGERRDAVGGGVEHPGVRSCCRSTGRCRRRRRVPPTPGGLVLPGWRSRACCPTHADRVDVRAAAGQAVGGAVEPHRPGAAVVVDDVLVLDDPQAGHGRVVGAKDT